MLKSYVEQFLEVLRGPRPPIVSDGDYDYRLVTPLDETIQTATLTGFVDAYKADLESEIRKRVFIHVTGPRQVLLKSLEADRFGRRQVYLDARCGEENAFKFGNFYAPDEFALALEAGFEPTEDIVKLVALTANLTASSSVQAADDGVSQVVTYTTGIVSKSTVTLPRRIPLAPFRTFREAPQVMTNFLVRMKGVEKSVPTVALYEVDGNKWKLDAMQSVKRRLQKDLPDAVIVA
jgi:hypothetical protein